MVMVTVMFHQNVPVGVNSSNVFNDGLRVELWFELFLFWERFAIQRHAVVVCAQLRHGQLTRVQALAKVSKEGHIPVVFLSSFSVPDFLNFDVPIARRTSKDLCFSSVF